MINFLKAMNIPLIGFDATMKQTLGVDVTHLENQWGVFLKQPLTLGTSSGSPVNTSSLSSIATMLTLVTIVLVVAAILVVLLVLITMHRRKRQLFSTTEEDTHTST